MVFLRAVLIFILSAAAHGAEHFSPPAGFMQPPEHHTAKAVNCPTAPAPFTGVLDFQSKYEGSDSARATLNPEADATFRQQTKAITDMERFVSRQVTAWAQSGNPSNVACVVNALAGWASAGALTGDAKNHTGRSMRKWALATFSSAWLQLQYSPQHPLRAYPAEQANIERWLSTLGDLTVSEWHDLPLNKVNNHSYWAAWAIMATAVVTQRRDLFTDALDIYRTAMQQIDQQGFLPNELRRRQRAFSYHNYAIQPLVMIALFARANGVDPKAENHDALQRLGEQVIGGLTDAQPFAQKTGVTQDVSFLQHPTNLAWLEGWCQLYRCDDALRQHIAPLRPLQNTRLGGDLSHLMAATARQE
ncbi:mannuronate-specific alginate lyase [Kosakonia sacchari]|uniref:Poly(Beta-D-mannuronate) lyase n=1 Tax=Kosakonia sacchari TaxID=1158459 RepID=A0A1G4X8E8_9ENTR|nr:mannuronate-specific alginate lyase [Kosakonia sacchari]AHJ73924.1 poly(beta-D-mannuronate) lyase [Kosakonia sacchari SP1]MDN2487973.1 mannuronate-specific alginate lyase [Kosakonia sacchari]SCX37479.1 poly(beta-D-mannuronate) lyase [Kosakonia sacchari]